MSISCSGACDRVGVRAAEVMAVPDFQREARFDAESGWRVSCDINFKCELFPSRRNLPSPVRVVSALDLFVGQNSMSDAYADPRAEEILAIIADETRIDRAALMPDATIDDLGIASLDLTQAVFEMETRFDIEIPVIVHQEGAEFATIGALVTHVLAVLDRASASRAQPSPALAAPNAAQLDVV